MSYLKYLDHNQYHTYHYSKHISISSFRERGELTMSTDEKLKRILEENNTIAVVGCSRDPEKPSHTVPKYMKEQGYKIIPINPFVDQILEEKVHKSLSEINEPVDIVNIFRPSEQCLEVVKEAVKLKPKVIWMQLGIKNEEAAQLAEKNGIEVIMDKCFFIEHKNLIKK
jgi:predicted CoA-binding protein